MFKNTKKCKSPPPPIKMNVSIRNLIEYLEGLFIIFSGDTRPVIPTPMMETHHTKIVFFDEWSKKGSDILHEIISLGIYKHELDEVGKFILESLFNMNQESYIYFPKEYKKKNTKKVYPAIDSFCVFIAPTRNDKPSNVEAFLQKTFGGNILVFRLLTCVPGTRELDISNNTLKTELEHLTPEQRKYLLQHGIKKFMSEYPNVFCSGNRPVWRPSLTPWGIKKVVKVFLGPNFSAEKLDNIFHHETVPICSCGLSTSNFGGFFEHLVANNDIIVLTPLGYRMEITPTSQQYKSNLAFVCKCKKHIKWCSLSTKYFQTFPGQGKSFHESIYQKLQKKASEYYALKKCAICLDNEVLYENQRIDGCGVKHADCICFDCYSNKLEQQNVVKGKLVFSHLHKCLICHVYYDTSIGRYLQTVPETHQTRWCNDCGNLFHDKPACDEDEIPIDCPSCFDKKEKQREFVECTHCGTMCSRKEGCDLCVCGRNYDSSYLDLYDEYGNRIDAGCGNPFCYGCGTPFKQDVIVDYTCPCYIEGTYPKQYNLANKQACQDKYYLLEWKYYIRDTILTIRQLGDRIQCNLQQTGDIPLSQSPRIRSSSPPRIQPSRLLGERRERAETFVRTVDVDVDMLSAFFSDL
jgi:hypothetical protein